MKLEIEIDLNDKSKVAAFILFLQAVNGAVVGTVETTLEEPVKETPVKKTTKKTVEKPVVEIADPKKVDERLGELQEQETKETEVIEEGQKITIEQIRETFATKVDNGDNRLILKTELSRLGAENLSKLDPSKYEEFLKFIENVQ